MEHTFEELKKKTVADLREIAKDIEHEALKGRSTMHKEQLLKALCEALGIESHEHHEAIGIDKSAIKAQIKKLKVERDAALEARNHKQLKLTRRKIHRLKRAIRRAMV
jgi:lipoate-protein ligase A